MAEKVFAFNSMSVLEDMEQLLESVNQAGNEKSAIESLRPELDLLIVSIEDIEFSVKGDNYLEIWVTKIQEAAKLIKGSFDKYVPKNSLLRDISVYMRIPRKSNGSGDQHNVKALLADIRTIEESSEFRDHMAGLSMSKARNYGLRPYFDMFDKNLSVTATSTVDLIENYVLGGEKRLSVIAVSGAGGVGKTTLAMKIYEVQPVKECFDFCTWITVPYRRKENWLLSYTAMQILTAGGQQIPKSKHELVEAVKQMLQKKRYLLVFDDVWSEDYFPILREILENNDTGSRIIFTTRKEAVASSCVESWYVHVHRVEPLSEAESRELFRKRVFGYSPPAPELVQLSHKVVGMCEGLPLAIEVIADFFSKKPKDADQWKILLESFDGDAFRSDRDLRTLSRILELSFVDLPPHLKQCFLYFGIFPEESGISNDRLFRYWIAENFVQRRSWKTLEEVAEEYLNELIGSNLVQPCEGFYGVEKFSRVPRLLREIAQRKSDEINFCQIRDNRETRFGGKSTCMRILTNNIENVSEAAKDSELRSVFLSDIGAINNSVVVGLFKKYKILTLLDLENSLLELLPNQVDDLSNLKYLSLKNTKLKHLPKSIGKLGKLQTLDLTGTLLVELPIGIANLRNLRHLLASRCGDRPCLDSDRGVKINEGIGNLRYLQTLMTIDANRSGTEVIRELRRLTELRSLSVSRLTEELSSALCACFDRLIHLESLRLQSTSDHVMDLQSVLYPPLLKRLVLKGKLKTFPQWISDLPSLGMLCLSLSGLADDPLLYLRHLPNLECLWLYRAYEGTRLRFNNGDFLGLKLLVLREMQGLESVELERGAVPILEELRIGPSPLLNEVPEGIAHLKNLKLVSFYDMADELVLSMQPDRGSEHWKVERVPSVLFWYRDGENRYINSYQLGDSDLLRRLEGLDVSGNGINWQNFRMSFSYTDDDASISSFHWDHPIARSDVSSDRFTFFTDDVEQ